MSKKICCIGTSHLGSLKTGWEKLASGHPEIEIIFFGAPNSGLTELVGDVVLSSNNIVPRTALLEQYFKFTSGGRQFINVLEYDAFVVIGCGIGLSPLFDLYRTHRSDAMRQGAGVLVSDNCIVDATSEIFLNSTASRYCQTIKSLCDNPVFVIPDPRPSAALLGQDGSPNPIWNENIKLIKQIQANQDGQVICALFRRALSALGAIGASVIEASGPLVQDFIFTPDEFCRGSIWLQNGAFEMSPNIDYFHMNEQFGERMLVSVINQLKT